ncbi:MAG: entry exclusion lipoprotein TrbK [Proteobacteria bacterium]|nr:entry exclusion lipoprotein TrbK [Burkholderiales bacterium]
MKRALLIATALVAVTLAGCGPERAPPLPNRDNTIDRVNKSLDRAQREGEQRRRPSDSAP